MSYPFSIQSWKVYYNPGKGEGMALQGFESNNPAGSLSGAVQFRGRVTEEDLSNTSKRSGSSG